MTKKQVDGKTAAQPARGPHTGLAEGETIEFKQSWSEDAMYDLAGFANHKGGTVHIGVDKLGYSVQGVDISDQAQQGIANKILAQLSLAPSISVIFYDNTPTLAIAVPQCQGGVWLRATYYIRSGSITTGLPREQLARVILRNINETWDTLPSNATLGDIDHEKVKAFIRSAKARANPRLPEAVQEGDDLDVVLANLDLLAENRPRNAAVLLFGKNPQRWFRTARISMVHYRDIDDFDALADVTGTVFEQIEGSLRATQIANPPRVTFGATVGDIVDRTRRSERTPYPELALKEAITNAIVHRDYTVVGSEAQIAMFEDRMVFLNPGGLLPGVNVQSLLRSPHQSVRRNPLVASICFTDYWVERYGTGTTRMMSLCREWGLPAPEFLAENDSFQVTFWRDIFAEDHLRRRGLNERQIRTVLMAKAGHPMTRRFLVAECRVPQRTAARDLDDLVEKGLMEREGKGRNTAYRLKRHSD